MDYDEHGNWKWNWYFPTIPPSRKLTQPNHHKSTLASSTWKAQESARVRPFPPIATHPRSPSSSPVQIKFRRRFRLWFISVESFASHQLLLPFFLRFFSSSIFFFGPFKLPFACPNKSTSVAAAGWLTSSHHPMWDYWASLTASEEWIKIICQR